MNLSKWLLCVGFILSIVASGNENEKFQVSCAFGNFGQEGMVGIKNLPGLVDFQVNYFTDNFSEHLGGAFASAGLLKANEGLNAFWIGAKRENTNCLSQISGQSNKFSCTLIEPDFNYSTFNYSTNEIHEDHPMKVRKATISGAKDSSGEYTVTYDLEGLGGTNDFKFADWSSAALCLFQGR